MPLAIVKKFAAPLLLILGTIIIISILSIFKPGTVKGIPPQSLAIPVETLQVQAQDFQLTLHSQGIIEASTQAVLSAQVSGNIISRSPQFERGGYFKRGDILLTLDDRDYLATLKLAEAKHSQAKVTLNEAEARSVAALNDWKRQGYEKSPSDLVARRPQVAAAKAELEAADAEVIKAQLSLSRTRITAPFDGRVIDNAIDIGNYVSPGTALAKIIEADKLQVSLPISASWRNMLDWNNTPITATLRLPRSNKGSLSNKSPLWNASIDKTSADISLGSRQLLLIATIDLNIDLKNDPSNSSITLLVGDYVDASITGRVLKNVFVLPRHALNEGHFVWSIRNSKLYKKDVNVIWVDSDVAIINQGLIAGDIISVTPLGAAVSGTRIKVIQP